MHRRTPVTPLPFHTALRRARLRWPRAVAAGLALALLSAMPAAAEPPPEGQCPSIAPAGRGGTTVDAIAIPLREGMLLDFKDMYSLLHLLPPEIWRNRHVFFHEGMKLNVGPCHRRYAVPSWFTDATQHYAGTAKLDDEGNLESYVAGLPFPPDAIHDEDPSAGLRWAWNHAYRWQGAGPSGNFRITDMPSRLGSIETYIGKFFQAQVAHRADLGATGYKAPEGDGFTWVSGGQFLEPFDARDLSWRQLRPVRTETRYEEPDDTFVYVPTMRKMRRGATTWVDGLYVPRYRVGGTHAGGGVPFGSTQYGPAGTIQPTAGVSAASSEHIRRGFVGMALRPNAYRWRVIKQREVLAPINGENPGFPVNPERNFGESGLSLGSDRWDVRWAVVLEGHARDARNEAQILTLYVDYQTQQPLFYISRKRNRRIVDIGILVHRYSGDLPEYPEWPTGGRARVFDPVAAIFYAVIEGGTGWRRESYDVTSLPLKASMMKGLTSTTDL
ncbi:MAG: DUF1329 domain-containing protein, partial [Deltaproteobacteria bacterium]|nr:DUF1329 domain-containing protein [Deltaproteobacteria bacterium]